MKYEIQHYGADGHTGPDAELFRREVNGELIDYYPRPHPATPPAPNHQIRRPA